MALRNPVPGGVGYIAAVEQRGAINLTRFSTTGSYIDMAHIAIGLGTVAVTSIEEMTNGDYLVAGRFTATGAASPAGVLVVRIDPVVGVVNHIVIGGDTSGRVVAREMSNGSVTVCFRRACSNALPGIFPSLANILLPANGAPPTLPWVQGYQATPGDALFFEDFREKSGTPNTIVVVGGIQPSQSLTGIPCIAEVNAVTGAVIGSVHTYDTGVVGSATFNRIEITPGGWYVSASESLLSFPNNINRLRVTKFASTVTRTWERTWALGMVATGIASRGGSSPALFVGGTHAGGNSGYLALFSPSNGAFGGCQTFNAGGTDAFNDMVLDYTAPNPLPVLAGRYNATLNNTGTNFGYFVRTAANGSTPCSLPVFPSEVAVTSTHGTTPFSHPPVVGGTNQPLPCNVAMTLLVGPFQSFASACVIVGGGTGGYPWAFKICGPCVGQCSIADMGGQGGISMICGDGQLDNNDFVVFINEFFAGAARADVGAQGGEHGSDGQFNNNDFVVFIESFFTGC